MRVYNRETAIVSEHSETNLLVLFVAHIIVIRKYTRSGKSLKSIAKLPLQKIRSRTITHGEP